MGNLYDMNSSPAANRRVRAGQPAPIAFPDEPWNARALKRSEGQEQRDEMLRRARKAGEQQGAAEGYRKGYVAGTHWGLFCGAMAGGIAGFAMHVALAALLGPM